METLALIVAMMDAVTIVQVLVQEVVVIRAQVIALVLAGMVVAIHAVILVRQIVFTLVLQHV